MSVNSIIPRYDRVLVSGAPECFFTETADPATRIVQASVVPLTQSATVDTSYDLLFPISRRRLEAVVFPEEDSFAGVSSYSNLIKVTAPLTSMQIKKTEELLRRQLVPVLRESYLDTGLLEALSVEGVTVGVFLDTLSKLVDFYLGGSGFRLSYKIIGGSGAGSIAFDDNLVNSKDVDVVFVIEYDYESSGMISGERDILAVLGGGMNLIFLKTIFCTFREALGVSFTSDVIDNLGEHLHFIEEHYLSQNLLVCELENQTVFKLMGCGILDVTFVVSSRCSHGCTARALGVDYRSKELVYYEDNLERITTHYEKGIYFNSSPFKVGVKRILKDFGKPWVKKIDDSNLALVFQDILAREPYALLGYISNLLGNVDISPVKKVYVVIKILQILNRLGDFHNKSEIFSTVMFSLEGALLGRAISSNNASKALSSIFGYLRANGLLKHSRQLMRVFEESIGSNATIRGLYLAVSIDLMLSEDEALVVKGIAFLRNKLLGDLERKAVLQQVLKPSSLVILLRECEGSKMSIPLLGVIYNNIASFEKTKLPFEIRMSLEDNKKIKDDRFVITILFLGSPGLDGSDIIISAFRRLKRADLGVFIKSCYQYLHPDSNEDVDNKGKIYSILTYCIENGYIIEARILLNLIKETSAFKVNVEDVNVEAASGFYKSVIVHNLYSSEMGLFSMGHNIVLSASRVMTTAEKVVVIAEAIIRKDLEDKRNFLEKSLPIMRTIFPEESIPSADSLFLLNKLMDLALFKEAFEVLKIVFQDGEGSFSRGDYLAVSSRLACNLSGVDELLWLIFNSPFVFDLKRRVSFAIDMMAYRSEDSAFVSDIASGFVERSLLKAGGSFSLFLNYMLKNKLHEEFLRLLQIAKFRKLIGRSIGCCDHDHLSKAVGKLLEMGCYSYVKVLYELACENEKTAIQTLIIDKVISFSCQESQRGRNTEPFKTDLFKSLVLSSSSQQSLLFYSRCFLSFATDDDDVSSVLTILEVLFDGYRDGRKKPEIFHILYTYKMKNISREDLIDVGASAVSNLLNSKLSRKNKGNLFYKRTIYSLLEGLEGLDWRYVNEDQRVSLFCILKHLLVNIKFYGNFPDLVGFVNGSVRCYSKENFRGYDMECLRLLEPLKSRVEFEYVTNVLAAFYSRRDRAGKQKISPIAAFILKHREWFF